MFEIVHALNARSEVYMCRVLLLGKGGLTSVLNALSLSQIAPRSRKAWPDATRAPHGADGNPNNSRLEVFNSLGILIGLQDYRPGASRAHGPLWELSQRYLQMSIS